MKLTKSTLKQIIKEELNKVLKEEDDGQNDGPNPGNIVDFLADKLQKVMQLTGIAKVVRMGEIVNAFKGLDDAKVAEIKAKVDSAVSEGLLRSLIDNETGEAQQMWQLVTKAWASSLDRLSPGKARQEINRHLKSGQIDKDTWRKLRRKHHRRQKRKPKLRKVMSPPEEWSTSELGELMKNFVDEGEKVPPRYLAAFRKLDPKIRAKIANTFNPPAK